MKLLLFSLILLAVGPASSHARLTATERKTIQVGPRDPDEDPIRGDDPVSCEDALGSDGKPLFGKKSPCVEKGKVPTGLKCDWYAGFQEYYCECTEEPDYCLDEGNVFCINGYESTKIALNGGRKFWNCKDSGAFFPPP